MLGERDRKTEREGKSVRPGEGNTKYTADGIKEKGGQSFFIPISPFLSNLKGYSGHQKGQEGDSGWLDVGKRMSVLLRS